MVDAAVSMVTMYALQSDGSLASLSTVATGQAATCWIAANGQYIFTDNTGSKTPILVMVNSEDEAQPVIAAGAQREQVHGILAVHLIRVVDEVLGEV